MITESKVTEIFCIADDFCKEFEVEMAKNALPSTTDAPKRKRKRMMSDAEVITILICFPLQFVPKLQAGLCYQEGEGRKHYLHDMRICQRWAVLNRKLISLLLMRFFPDVEVKEELCVYRIMVNGNVTVYRACIDIRIARLQSYNNML